MHNQEGWTKGILKWGLVLIALGLVAALVGHMFPGRVGGVDIGRGFMPALGAVLIGLGIVCLAQYAYVRRDPKAGQQMMINESDERLQLIRARAGHRAFWISSALAYFVLNWVSFAGDVGLPRLSADALWWCLLAIVVAPLIVYMGSIRYEQKNK